MLDSLAHFHFLRPWWLLLMPVVVGLWWSWQRQSDPLRGWRAQMDPDLLEALTVREEFSGTGGEHRRLAAWLLTVLAIAGPTWRPEPSPFADDAAPLMIVLKAGETMNRGTPPATPLERARLKITDLTNVRKGEPVGLMAYAGSAHLVLPPTRDTQVVAEMAAQISPEVMPVPGDRLDLALQEAGQLLTGNAAGGSLLVIADSFDGDVASLATVTQDHEAFPIQVLLLSPEDTPEADSLRQAARALGATVQLLTADDQDVRAVVDRAARQSIVNVGGESPRWQEMGYWLIPPIALLVALSFRRRNTMTMEASP